MSVKQTLAAAWLGAALVAMPLGGMAIAAPAAPEAPSYQVAFLGHHSATRVGHKHHRLRNAALAVGGVAIAHHAIKKHRMRKAVRNSQAY